MENNEAKSIIDSLVKDTNIVFVQIYVSADGIWPDPELGSYSDWRDYIHMKGGNGHYNPDVDDPEEYAKSCLYGCDDCYIIAVEYKTSQGEEISIPLEC